MSTQISGIPDEHSPLQIKSHIWALLSLDLAVDLLGAMLLCYEHEGSFSRPIHAQVLRQLHGVARFVKALQDEEQMEDLPF